MLRAIIFLVLLSRASFGITSQGIREQFFIQGVQPLEHKFFDQDLIELGRSLYFDKILSGNKNISCATCHHPALGSGDELSLPIGEGGEGLGTGRVISKGHFIPRNAPQVYNLGLKGFNTMMWDGRIALSEDRFFTSPEPGLQGQFPELAEIASALDTALALQAMFPVTSHHEMRGDIGSNDIADAQSNKEVWEKLISRVLNIDEYQRLFQKAYPFTNISDINFGHAANAIAAFETVFFASTNSPFDQFLAGDDQALSPSELEGAKLFAGKAQCLNCHNGAHLSDQSFYSLGTPQLGNGKGQDDGEPLGEDRGLSLRTGDSSDDYKFRTPPLRNVSLTGPWLHSGAYNDLRSVVIHHLRPWESLWKYLENDPSMQDGVLCDEDELRNINRSLSIDPLLRDLEEKEYFNDQEIDALVDFLYSMTDYSVLDLADEVPSSVPSGIDPRD